MQFFDGRASEINGGDVIIILLYSVQINILGSRDIGKPCLSKSTSIARPMLIPAVSGGLLSSTSRSRRRNLDNGAGEKGMRYTHARLRHLPRRKL